MTVSVVTGATSGIGRWIAAGLARAGHDVVIIARDEQRAAATKDWIGRQVTGAKVEWLIADLSLLAATAEVGAELLRSHPAIDVLVANAGVFCAKREVTAEGHERVIAVNHLSPFVLTCALLPALQAAGTARIVNTGSSSSDHASIYPADLEGRNRWGLLHTYSQSKLALLMTTITWAQRLRGTGVVANVVHPGAVATSLIRAGGLIGLAWRGMSPFLLTEVQGADSPLHVALAPSYQTISGAYVKRREVVRPNRLTRDADLVERVWRATERLAGVSPAIMPNGATNAGSRSPKSGNATGASRGG
jgi:NAD(P)-dependent dehydrogenase (short-subunit alcohol dehydrogenase family)